MLNKLEIPNKINKNGIIIEGKGIRQFYERVGFSKQVKMTKGSFEGYDKNSVLVQALIGEISLIRAISK